MLTAEKDRPFSVAVALESLMMNQPLAALAYLRLIDTQRSKSADDTGEKSHPSELSPHG